MKKNMVFISYFTVLFLWSLPMMNLVMAASYNVFFNNVEQGENGVANPQLNIENGKLKKKINNEATTTQALEVNKDQQKLNMQETTEQTNVSQAPIAQSSEVAAKNPNTKWKMSILGHVFDSSHRNLKEGKNPGATLAFSYFPKQDFSLEAFAGITSNQDNFYGGGFEVTPLKQSIFGLRDFIELGVKMGATNLGNKAADLWGSAYVGPSVRINFGQDMGISSSVVGNITNRSSYKYYMANAGFFINL